MLFTSILILIVAKALPLFSRSITSIHFTRITAMILLFSGILSLNILYLQSIGNGIGIYSGLFQITNISQTIEFFLLIIGTGIIVGFNNKNNNWAIDYSIIILFSTLGSSLLLSSFDLISIYLSIELQSFGLYILTTLYRNSRIHGINSSNAGLKYFLLGGLSSAIILLGAGIIYSYTGLTQLESIYTLLSSLLSLNISSPIFVSSINIENIEYVAIATILGIIFIVIGLLFKIAAAPLHNWSPDVYDETPTIVTTWLTIIPKISILILLLELYLLTWPVGYTPTNEVISSFLLSFSLMGNSLEGLGLNNLALVDFLSEGLGNSLKNILLISSFASLIIGTVVGLAQIKIKRLLAYSTISHIGFMLLALAINTNQSIDSFLFYLIQYIITNLNIFLILLAISYIYLNNTKTVLAGGQVRDIKYISELQGLFFNNPILSLTLSISLFSMAGIPPLIGFFSKQFVLNSALDQGYYFLSIIAIIVSVISASYYLKIIKVLHYNNVESSSNTNSIVGRRPILVSQEALVSQNISASLSFIISSLSLFILLFIIKPTLILSSTQVLSLTLFQI